MRKLVLAVLLLHSVAMFATAPALTAVTATLQDSSTQVWANATWTTTFIPPPGSHATFNNNGNAITNNQSGTADGSGVFSVSLDDNLVVAPGGSAWKFTVCPNASTTSCNDLLLTITGATMNISSQLNAVLTVPVVNSSPVIARAYNDTEVNGSYGTLYINSITNVLKECLLLFCQGTGWTAITPSTNNPVFTGTLTVPCVKFNFSVADDTTVCSQTGTGHIAVTLPASAGTLALLASPAFTGTPTAPTATLGDNTTKLATTAFVQAAVGGAGAVSSVFGRTGAVVAATNDYSVAQVNGAAPLASPTFTGTPAAPTAGAGTNTTQLATTAFVATSFAPLASPTFTGVPAAPTASLGTNTTQIATTAFVLANAGGSTNFVAPTGVEHFLTYNNSTTLSSSSGNNWPGGLWSQLGGTFASVSNIASTNTPANYRLVTTGGGAGASSSIAEDAVAQQGTFNIFGAYACYCAVELGGQHIVWMAMSSVLYGTLGVVNPNGTVFGFRYAGTVDTNWQAYVSTASGTFTATDTGVAVDANFHQFAFAANSTGGIDYFIDGTKVATNASGVTGFPAGGTAVYAALENGLIGASVNLSTFFNSVRWWTKK